MTVFSQRRARLCRLLSQYKIDYLLVVNPINVRYLSGFTGDSTYLLISKSDAVLLSDGRYTTQLEAECPDLPTQIRDTAETLLSLICKLYGKLSKRFGFEADAVSVAIRDRLVDALKSGTLVPLEGVVERLRIIKDRTEIAAIRKSAAAANKGYNYIRNILQPAMTEADIRTELEYQMRKAGAETVSFPSIIAAGSNAAQPHARPSNRKIGGEQLLLIDWGAMYDGYASDLTRTIFLKKPSAKLLSLYKFVAEAQHAAICAIKPGKKCSDIDAVARKIITNAGYGKQFNHGLGHGIGLEIHEQPRFVGSSETVLEAGMVITVEPGIYIPDWGGIRIEDDILVTKTGCEILTADVKYEPEAFL
ncbi:MAG: Xaa-Pro peptidase family protein [Planctomycetaceae bacterium]|jgi:Xaa-Pro aminopeptidase|nr:Xaa-Pro peptidase family protein [Planctomycetaceae bacterium]